MVGRTLLPFVRYWTIPRWLAVGEDSTKNTNLVGKDRKIQGVHSKITLNSHVKRQESTCSECKKESRWRGPASGTAVSAR